MLNPEDLHEFERFWKPEQGETVKVAVSNWNKTIKDFRGKKETHLTMEVLAINGTRLPRTKEFSTGSVSFARAAIPLFLAAQDRGETVLELQVERTKDNRYNVIDNRVVEQAMRTTNNKVYSFSQR